MQLRQDWLAEQLPVAVVADPFLRKFLRVFAEVADGVQVHAHAVVDVVDVTVAPPEMVRWLGTWVGMDDIDPSLPEARRRELVRGVGRLLGWRGTRRGLRDLLELLTGGEVHVVDTGRVLVAGEEPNAGPFVWIRIDPPAAADARPPRDDALLSLIAAELPPNVGFELRWGDRVVGVDDREGTARGGRD